MIISGEWDDYDMPSQELKLKYEFSFSENSIIGDRYSNCFFIQLPISLSKHW